MEPRTGQPLRATLTRHPESPPSPVERIEVEVERTASGAISLHYHLLGDLARVGLPSTVEQTGFTDELWKHTCLEAFVRLDGEGYLELNLSPSGDWAVYGFAGYRDGMTALDLTPTVFRAALSDDRYELVAVIDLPANASAAVGIAAVIEDVDGGKSWWALAHAPGKPDFHHPHSFVLELP